jgi:hypothetical protein
MDPLRPTSPIPSPAAPLVAALVPVASQLHAVLAHMERCSEEAPPDASVPPVPEVLAGLLETVLGPLAKRCSREAETAAWLLGEVAEQIERELFLVTPDRG